MFSEHYGKIINKHSSSNLDGMFIQNHLIFNNVLKTFVQKLYLYVVHGMFS